MDAPLDQRDTRGAKGVPKPGLFGTSFDTLRNNRSRGAITKGGDFVKTYLIRVSCMSANYIVEGRGETEEEAIEDARARAMKDMKHWSYGIIEEKREGSGSGCY